MSHAIPYLRNSGDLGAYLFRLMSGIEKIDKIAHPVQKSACDCVGSMNNTGTPDAAPARQLAAELYESLTGVLAACGHIDAMRLVQGFRPSLPESHT